MRPANDNAPIFTPGLDGYRMWINGKVEAWGLSFEQAQALKKAFEAQQQEAA